LNDNSPLSTEWLEAIYTHRTVRVTFSTPESLHDNLVSTSPWGMHPQHLHLIRHLLIRAPEARIFSPTLLGLEHECSVNHAQLRADWAILLNLPHLSRLTIELQKTVANAFIWANFSPILYALRSRLSKLNISLLISFDELLKAKWEAWPPLDRSNRDTMTTTQPNPYLPMEWVDVSDLIAPPSEEDRVYVKEHMQGLGVEDVGARHAVRGLLDETPQSRRVLAGFYVVKEPALLRVLMEEHYEVWKKVKGDVEKLEGRK
jgi:hypothetical protein